MNFFQYIKELSVLPRCSCTIVADFVVWHRFGSCSGLSIFNASMQNGRSGRSVIISHLLQRHCTCSSFMYIARILCPSLNSVLDITFPRLAHTSSGLLGASSARSSRPSSSSFLRFWSGLKPCMAPTRMTFSRST